MAQFKQWFEQDFTEKIEIRHCESVMFTGDDQGAIVGVRLYNDGTPYSSGGVVTGAVKRYDGGVVALTGTLSGNAASVVIPAAALAYPGPIGVHIVLTQGGSVTTVLKAIYSVDDNTGTPVDPGNIVPSYEELLGEIETMREATADASAAVTRMENMFTAVRKNGSKLFVYDSLDPELKTAVAYIDSATAQSNLDIQVWSRNMISAVQENKDLSEGRLFDGSYMVTYFIPVKAGATYIIYSSVPETIAGEVAFYSGATEGTYLSRAFSAEEFTVPEGANYIRKEFIITGYSASSVDLMICEKSFADAKGYTPFQGARVQTIPFTDINGNSFTSTKGTYYITEGRYVDDGGTTYTMQPVDIALYSDGSFLWSTNCDLEITYYANPKYTAQDHRVYVEQFGAAGDGVSDDSLAFDDAINWCNALHVPLYLENKSYIAKNITAEKICSIIGDGFPSINVGTKTFTYENDFSLENVEIISEAALTKNDSVPAQFQFPVTDGTATATNHVYLRHVAYTCANADDTHRGPTFMRLLVNNCDISDVNISGAWNGLVMGNVSGLVNNGNYFEQIHGRNVKTLIDIEGYYDNPPFNGQIGETSISHVTLINTAAEQLNYAYEQGADCILISYVNGVTISDVYCERVVERAIYAVCCQNITINNVTSILGEGVKVAGLQKRVYGEQYSGYILSKNICISSLSVYDSHNRYCLMMYEVDGAHISGVTHINQSGIAPFYGIALTGICRNVKIQDVYTKNTNRGVFLLYAIGGRETNELRNIYISDVVSDDPAKINYNMIRFWDESGRNQTYAYNIHLDNVQGNPGTDKYDAESNFAGLIDAKYCDGLYLTDCDANGINAPGDGITIDSTCQNVHIAEKTKVYADSGSPVNLLHGSDNADIRIVSSAGCLYGHVINGVFHEILQYGNVGTAAGNDIEIVFSAANGQATVTSALEFAYELTTYSHVSV